MCSTPPLAGQWQWLVTWEGGSSVAGPGTPPPVILQLLLLIHRNVARRSQDTRTQQWPAVTSPSTPGSRMSFLRGSANYVWCTTSVLGKGATGAVFQVSWKLFTPMKHPIKFYSSTRHKENWWKLTLGKGMMKFISSILSPFTPSVIRILLFPCVFSIVFH